MNDISTMSLVIAAAEALMEMGRVTHADADKTASQRFFRAASILYLHAGQTVENKIQQMELLTLAANTAHLGDMPDIAYDLLENLLEREMPAEARVNLTQTLLLVKAADLLKQNRAKKDPELLEDPNVNRLYYVVADLDHDTEEDTAYRLRCLRSLVQLTDKPEDRRILRRIMTDWEKEAPEAGEENNDA